LDSETVSSERAAQFGAPAESAVQSIQRAASILGCFARERPELGVTDLSRELGLHKSTVSRLLTALRDAGLVVQVAGTGKYRLGAKVLEMADVVLASLELSGVAEPQMRLLADATGETVSLVVLEDGVCVDLYAVPSRHAIRAVRHAGHAVACLTSAGGRLLVALQASGRTAEGAVGPGAPMPDAMLAQALEEVHITGCVLVQGEMAPDLIEVAAPVWDYRERVVAALTVSAPAQRLTRDRVAGVCQALLGAARSISHALGYRS
jgi:IclR family transcriptional regulator, KDG regulon repressor